MGVCDFHISCDTLPSHTETFCELAVTNNTTTTVSFKEDNDLPPSTSGML